MNRRQANHRTRSSFRTCLDRQHLPEGPNCDIQSAIKDERFSFHIHGRLTRTLCGVIRFDNPYALNWGTQTAHVKRISLLGLCVDSLPASWKSNEDGSDSAMSMADWIVPEEGGMIWPSAMWTVSAPGQPCLFLRCCTAKYVLTSEGRLSKPTEQPMTTFAFCAFSWNC